MVSQRSIVWVCFCLVGGIGKVSSRWNNDSS